MWEAQVAGRTGLEEHEALVRGVRRRRVRGLESPAAPEKEETSSATLISGAFTGPWASQL
jgi:hypothetical protein